MTRARREDVHSRPDHGGSCRDELQLVVGSTIADQPTTEK